MDPLSVTASIVGILAASGKVIEIIGPVVGALKDTAKSAATVHAEVSSSRIILSALQRLFADLGNTPVKRRELIQIDQLIATLTDGILIFNELEPLVVRLGSSTENLRARMRWALKGDPLESFVFRMQLFRSSISVMLNILQCESDLEAARNQEDLYALTSNLLKSNRDITRRLSLLERPSQDDTSITTVRRSRPFSTATVESSIREFAFERDLKGSWVYRRVRRSTTDDKSFRTSVALSHAWSALSEISLSDVSAISVVALPISCSDLVNGYHYWPVGEVEVPAMLQIHPSQNSRELVISAPTLISTTVEVPATMQTHPRISAPTLISATWGWPDQIPILSLHSDQGDQQLTSAPHLSPVQRHENKEEEQAAFWIPQATPDGKLFYFNTLTGLSTLEIPSENDLHRIPRPIAGPALTGPGPQLSKTGRQLRLEALSKSVRVRRYNIAVVGSSDVSNFAFMIQFFDVDGKSTEEFLPKRCIIDGEAAILKPSNPLGQEDNPATREQCVRNAEGVILLYSVTDRQSLIEVLKFRRQISRLKQTDSVPTILVGDYMESLEKPKVSTHEGQFLANALGLKFREVSILNKTNVEEAFYDVIRHIRSTEEELLLERSRKSWVDELDFANHERDMASDFNV